MKSWSGLISSLHCFHTPLKSPSDCQLESPTQHAAANTVLHSRSHAECLKSCSRRNTLNYNWGVWFWRHQTTDLWCTVVFSSPGVPSLPGSSRPSLTWSTRLVFVGAALTGVLPERSAFTDLQRSHRDSVTKVAGRVCRVVIYRFQWWSVWRRHTGNHLMLLRFILWGRKPKRSGLTGQRGDTVFIYHHILT